MHRRCISIPLKNYQPHYSKGSLSTSIDLEEVKQLIPKQGVGNKIVINGNKAWYFIRERPERIKREGSLTAWGLIR